MYSKSTLLGIPAALVISGFAVSSAFAGLAGYPVVSGLGEPAAPAAAPPAQLAAAGNYNIRPQCRNEDLELLNEELREEHCYRYEDNAEDTTGNDNGGGRGSGANAGGGNGPEPDAEGNDQDPGNSGGNKGGGND